MYLNAVVDPAERTFYDSYDQTAWWCVKTQTALGPDRAPRRPGRLLRGPRLLLGVRQLGETQ